MDAINTNRFWSLVDKAVDASGGDDALKRTYLTAELETLSLDEIKEFEIALRKCIIDADDFTVLAAQNIIEAWGPSDDSYLYFRCWLIGQGERIYTETLKNPDYLADIVDVGESYEWEELLYVATDAYANKTGKEEDETFPRDTAISMGLDYDFGPPRTKGTDWRDRTEDQLPTLLPRLWAKFN